MTDTPLHPSLHVLTAVSVIRARRWSRANAETLAEISAKPRTGGLGRCVQGGLKGADHKGDD